MATIQSRHVTCDDTQSYFPVITGAMFADEAGVGTITATNADFTTDIAGSSIIMDCTGKATLSFQITGTWSMATGGLYPQVSLDGTHWISIYSTYPLLDIADNDYDSFVYSGQQSIWQVDVTGCYQFRLLAVGTTFAGTVNISIRSTSHRKQQFIDLPGIPVNKFLTVAGDGTGTNSFITDLSATPTTLFYQPPGFQKLYLTTLYIQISGATKFNQTDYGSITALTNGITFFIKIGGVELSLFASVAFKSNSDWYAFTNHNVLTAWSGTAETLGIEISLLDDFGMPLIIDGAQGQQLICKLHDNFTGLVNQRFLLKGRQV